MLKRVLRAVGILLGLAIAVLVVLWFLPPTYSSTEKRRYEDALLGKTLEQVKATLGARLHSYHTKEQFQKLVAEPVQWPDGEEAIGIWIKGRPPNEEAIYVHFDKEGLAMRIQFSSQSSFQNRLRSWLPF
jgi:hypothetical protein